MSARIVCALLLLSVLPAAPTVAQDGGARERIGRDRPLLMPAPTAPRGRVNDLVFVEHDRRTWLLAAASDKVVHRWEVAPGGTLTPAEPLRWPIFRGIRGSIYTITDLGDGRVAIAGVGAKTSQVSLLSVDGRRAPVRLVDAKTRARQNVWCVEADPDRRNLFVGEGPQADGRAMLLCWSYRGEPSIVGRVRTDLGNVKALSVSPDGGHVVVAGPLARGGAWGVRVYSVATLSRFANGIADPVAGTIKAVQEAEFTSKWDNVVTGLDWIDDDTWIAGTVLGYARGTLRGAVDQAGFAVAANMRGAAFLVTPGRAGATTVENTSPRTVTFRDEQNNDTREIAPGASFAFGANARLSRLYDRENKLGPFPALPGQKISIPTYVRHLEFDRVNSRLFSSYDVDSRFHVTIDTRDANGAMTRRGRLANEWVEVTSIGVSPDGRYVAAAGIENFQIDGKAGFGQDADTPVGRKDVSAYQIRVYDAATGRVVGRFPDESEGLPVGGPILALTTLREGKVDTVVYQCGLPKAPGRHYFQIYPGITDAQEDIDAAKADAAFDAKGKRTYQFATDRERRRGVIDVTTGRFNPTPGARGVPAIENFFQNGSNVVGPVYTSPDNPVTCCLVFKAGDGQWYLAIGQYDGVQVWNLQQCSNGDGYRALARAYYGHDSQVTSIDVSGDGNQLYSASTDGTICGWSLRNMAKPKLGLALNGRTVRSVDSDSPGWYAGFEQGPTVTKLQIQGIDVPLGSIAARLSDPLPGMEYFFTATDARRKTIQLQTPVAHDPLWTYYPRHDRECVTWTPEGYFDTQNVNTLNMVEWIVNLGGPLGQSDEVVVMAGLDQDGSVLQDADKIESAAFDAERPESDIPSPPVIELKNTASGWSLTANASSGTRIAAMELLLNGREIANSDSGAITVSQSKLDALQRTGTNSLAGIVRTSDGKKEFGFRRIVSFESRAGAKRKPRLNFLGIAVRAAPNQTPLKTVVGDVNAVSKAFAGVADRLSRKTGHPTYDFTNVADGYSRLLTGDDEATAPSRANVTKAFADLAAAVQPDDITMIVLSSHGTLENKEYVFHASDGTIPQSTLTDVIQQLPCRTLLVLDTCHAGGAAGNQDQITQFARVVNGPMLLTACRPDEEAFALDTPQYSHGFFLAAVQEALNGTAVSPKSPPMNGTPDADRDGWVTVEEFARFVQVRTQANKRKLDSNARKKQTPQVVASVFFTDARTTPLAPAP